MLELTKHIMEIGTVLPAQVSHAALVESDKPFTAPKATDPFHKLIFVRMGTLEVLVNDESFEVGAGQTLLILPNETSQLIHSTSCKVKYYFAFFCVKGTRQCSVKIGLERLTAVNGPDRLTALFHLLIENKYGHFVDTPALRLLFMQILAETTQDGTPVPAECSSAVALVGRGKAYVRRHFAEPLSAAVVADALDVSPHYFGRLFRKHAGVSLTEFITTTRTYSARVRLVETDLPIKQIARECGFEDAGYFSRVFLKREGMSPKAYRQLHSGIFEF